MSEPAARTFYLEAARSSGLLLLRPPPPSPLGSSGVRVRSEGTKALHGIRISENDLKMTTSSARDLSQKIGRPCLNIKKKVRCQRTMFPIHILLRSSAFAASIYAVFIMTDLAWRLRTNPRLSVPTFWTSVFRNDRHSSGQSAPGPNRPYGIAGASDGPGLFTRPPQAE